MDYNLLKEKIEIIFTVIDDMSVNLPDNVKSIDLPEDGKKLIEDQYDQTIGSGRIKRISRKAPEFQLNIQIKYQDNSDNTIDFGVVSDSEFVFKKFGSKQKKSTIGNQGTVNILFDDVTYDSIEKILRDLI